MPLCVLVNRLHTNLLVLSLLVFSFFSYNLQCLLVVGQPRIVQFCYKFDDKSMVNKVLIIISVRYLLFLFILFIYYLLLLYFFYILYLFNLIIFIIFYMWSSSSWTVTINVISASCTACKFRYVNTSCNTANILYMPT